MRKGIEYYGLVCGCGGEPQKGCILEQLKLKDMTLAQLRQIKGFIDDGQSDGDEYKIRCWRGRERFGEARLLIIKKVK